MAVPAFNNCAMQQLQSNHRNLLDDIDHLRSQGIGQHVDLPQIIVCGDQSSGKSSVLEAISRVRFPVKDDLCTSFATELVLRRATQSTITISIKPGRNRTLEERQSLLDFQTSFSSPQDLPNLVEEAKKAMGSSMNFSDDVLRVEISGPDQPHLTLVDLPGIIHTATRREDIQLVRDLVEGYMKTSRTIILAVITAKADAATQIIFDLLKTHDPRGLRTMGIITKPDALSEGTNSEKNFLKIAQNEAEDMRFQYGWHVLRNRDEKSKKITDDERDEMEAAFLAKGVWSNLQSKQKGAASLRRRLSEVLMDHISRALPSLINEINLMQQICREDLKKLGDSRQTPKEQRQFLTKISSEFQKLIRESREGLYLDSVFDGLHSEQWSSKLLRASLHVLNNQFASTMVVQGHKRQITGTGPIFSTAGSTQVSIKREDLMKELDLLAEKTRDVALPGFPNARLVRTLFQDQCSPWKSIASQHMDEVWNTTRDLLRKLLSHVTSDEVLASVSKQVLEPWFNTKKTEMESMLDLLIKPHQRGHPMTYRQNFLATTRSHHSVTRMTKVRNGLAAKRSGDITADHFTWRDIQMVFQEAEEDDQYSSSDIISYTEAYYEIALNNFIDNVAVLGIETCLIDQLSEVFTPDTIAGLEDRDLDHLASESEETRAERKRLQDKLEALKLGLQTCSAFHDPINSLRVVQDQPEPSTGPQTSFSAPKQQINDSHHQNALPQMYTTVASDDNDDDDERDYAALNSKPFTGFRSPSSFNSPRTNSSSSPSSTELLSSASSTSAQGLGARDPQAYVITPTKTRNARRAVRRTQASPQTTTIHNFDNFKVNNSLDDGPYKSIFNDPAIRELSTESFAG